MAQPETGRSERKRPALRLVDTKDLSRKEWLEVRKSGIGGSDAAAAIGLKSTTQSYRSAIYYVDIGVRGSGTLEEAIGQARELDARRKEAGFNQAALDDAARAGFANGAFEDSVEEIAAVTEEFYPAAEPGSGASGERGDRSTETTAANATVKAGKQDAPSRLEKLEQRAVLVGGTAA